MAAKVIEIADAVAAALNGATLSQSFTAVRAYVPVFDLKDLAALKVTVVPRELSVTPQTRAGDEFEYAVDVAVQKVVGVGATTEAQLVAAADPLMAFTEEVLDLFRGNAAVDSVPARFVGATNASIYDPAHLDEKRVFTSVVTLTFRKSRPK